MFDLFDLLLLRQGTPADDRTLRFRRYRWERNSEGDLFSALAHTFCRCAASRVHAPRLSRMLRDAARDRQLSAGALRASDAGAGR